MGLCGGKEGKEPSASILFPLATVYAVPALAPPAGPWGMSGERETTFPALGSLLLGGLCPPHVC